MSNSPVLDVSQDKDVMQSLVSAYCKLNPYPVYMGVKYFADGADNADILAPKEVLIGKAFDQDKIHNTRITSRLLSEAQHVREGEDEQEGYRGDSSYARERDKEWNEGFQEFQSLVRAIMETSEYRQCPDASAKYSILGACASTVLKESDKSAAKGLQHVVEKAVEDGGIQYQYGCDSDFYKSVAGKSASFVAQKLLEKSKQDAGVLSQEDLSRVLAQCHPKLAGKIVRIGSKMCEMQEASGQGGLKAAKLKVMNCVRSFFNGICGYRGKNIGESLETFTTALSGVRSPVENMRASAGNGVKPSTLLPQVSMALSSKTR